MTLSLKTNHWWFFLVPGPYPLLLPCLYICIHPCMHACMYVCMYVYAYTYVFVSVYVWAYVHVYMSSHFFDCLCICYDMIMNVFWSTYAMVCELYACIFYVSMNASVCWYAWLYAYIYKLYKIHICRCMYYVDSMQITSQVSYNAHRQSDLNIVIRLDSFLLNIKKLIYNFDWTNLPLKIKEFGHMKSSTIGLPHSLSFCSWHLLERYL